MKRLLVKLRYLLRFPVLPLLHGFLPVGLFACSNGFLLTLRLVALTVALTLRLHVGDGAVVENHASAELS